MRSDPVTSANTDTRVFRVLDRLQRFCLGLIVIGGGLFVFSYRSDNAVLGGYSWKYLLVIVMPFLALTVCLGAGHWAGTILARLPRRWRPLPELALGATGVLLAILAPEPRVAVTLFVLAGGIAVTSWAWYRQMPHLLLASLCPIMLTALMMAIEMPVLIRERQMVVWGQPNCFAYGNFPEQPPFIGPGGRLRSNLDAYMQAPEYPDGARLVTNNLGLRNHHDFPAAPDSGTQRILSLGDSFATGFCADQDHFFGSLLARALADDKGRYQRCEVLNAEVSDPAYGLRYLQQYGLDLAPQIVLYGLCGNDVMQAFWFAGPGRRFQLREGRLLANPVYGGDPMNFFERFEGFTYKRSRLSGARQDRLSPVTKVIDTLAGFRLFADVFDQTPRQRPKPVITQGYGKGYQSTGERLRLLDGGANFGFYLQPASPICAQMYDVFFSVLQALANSAADAGARFVLVLFPQRHQVQSVDWDVMQQYWNLDPVDFDLESPSRKLGDFCIANGIECVDLLDDFRIAAAAGSLYLPGGDVHFNRQGHAVAAAGVAEYLCRQQ